MSTYCDQCERRDDQICRLQERLEQERRISDGCRADASRLGERIQELEGQREYLRPDLMKHFNEHRSLFGPVPLSDSYGEKWLIEKLLSAGALLERERQQREKLEGHIRELLNAGIVIGSAGGLLDANKSDLDEFNSVISKLRRETHKHSYECIDASGKCRITGEV